MYPVGTGEPLNVLEEENDLTRAVFLESNRDSSVESKLAAESLERKPSKD